MVRFDDASNTRVVQMMKSDKDFNDDSPRSGSGM